MRLREIEFHLLQSSDLLDTFDAEQIANSSPVRFSISSLASVRHALLLIKKTGLFPEEREMLRLSSVSNNNLDTIQVTNEEFRKIQVAITALKTNSKIVLESLNIALPKSEDDDCVVYIKLPELKDFDDLSKILDQLRKAIQLPIAIEGIGGHVFIRNFDSGSRWLELVVKTTLAANLIGSLAWSGAVIFKKYQEAKIVEEHATRVKLGTKHFEALVEANTAQMNLLIEAEALYIQKEYCKNPNPEDLERLKLSVKTMSELIEKGAEIQPALLAPESVSNLFPDYSNLMLIESNQKLLDNK